MGVNRSQVHGLHLTANGSVPTNSNMTGNMKYQLPLPTHLPEYVEQLDKLKLELGGLPMSTLGGEANSNKKLENIDRVE